METNLERKKDTEFTEKKHQSVLNADSNLNYPIVVLDNGSYSIKAGFAGQMAPAVVFQNCALQAFGRREGRVTIGSSLSSSGSSSGQVAHQSFTTSERYNNLFLGDDIYTLPESFCQRPFSHGLLVNNELEVAIWEKLFSKGYLNISDPSSYGILVTEHCNTPATCRYALTQIVFEQFGFDRVVISPGQQLVPFAFSVGLPPQNVSLREPYEIGPLSKNKTRKGNVGKDFSLLRSWKVGDEVPLTSSDQFSHVCQIVVDVGHQTTWIVPMYREMPIDIAISRIDLGGAHVSALLSRLLSYRQIDLERHELLTHHLKEESCFVSLNYQADVRLAQRAFSAASLLGSNALCHLTHRYYLPNLNIKEKTFLKRFFKTTRTVHLPQYEYREDSAQNCDATFVPVGTTVVSFTDLLKQQENETSSSQQSSLEKSSKISANSEFSENDVPMVYMNLERIKPPELFFYPSDYQLSNVVSKKTPANKQVGTSSKQAPHIPQSKHDASSMERLEPFEPQNQCGIAEGIERTIFSCPSLLQPYMAEHILLCGGSSCLPNFARRLYMELRPRLPQEWPICIFQQECPSMTSWIGGSLWAGKLNSSGYHTFSLTRAQYLESG